VNASDL